MRSARRAFQPSLWVTQALRILLVLVGSLILASCAKHTVRADRGVALNQQYHREALLARHAGWSLAARLAVSGGGEGGSGRLLWVQQDDYQYSLDVQAPITRQTWRLEVGSGLARLEGLEGGTREGVDATDLLAREVGWVLPLADLASWARGARSTRDATIEFGADGLPAQIVEHGWVIDYRDWFRELSPPMPKKIFAQNGDRRVRLVIDRWQTLGEP